MSSGEAKDDAWGGRDLKKGVVGGNERGGEIPFASLFVVGRGKGDRVMALLRQGGFG